MSELEVEGILNTRMENTELKCPHCDELFSHRFKLKQHKADCHPTVEMDEPIIITKNIEDNQSDTSSTKMSFDGVHVVLQKKNDKDSDSSEKVFPPKKKSIKNKNVVSQEEYNRLREESDGESRVFCSHCTHLPFSCNRYLFQHITKMHPEQTPVPLSGTSEDTPTITRKSISKKSNIALKAKSLDDSDSSDDDLMIVKASGEDIDRNSGKYKRDASRKSYTNDFKAKIISEADKGVSRKNLSILYNVPPRTIEKWVTKQHDIILVGVRDNSEVAGFKRLRVPTAVATGNTPLNKISKKNNFAKDDSDSETEV